MNTLESCKIMNPQGIEDDGAMFIVDDTTVPFSLHDIVTVGENYILHFWIKSQTTGMLTVCGTTIQTSNEWVNHTVLFTANDVDIDLIFTAVDTYYIYHPKLETGNKATDWTPAPEDVDVEIKEAMDAANEAALAAASISAQQEIDGGSILSISNQLANLIVGENGEAVFKEVLPDGTIRYNFSNMQGNIKAAVDDITKLQNSDKTTKDKIDAIDGIIEKHSKTLSYIDQGTIQEGEDKGLPFIELGILKDEDGNDSNAKFKVRITNKSIQFMEEDNPVAWIDNEELHIRKSEIVNEQRVGDFVWSSRSNGNMGLMWKGGTS